MGLVEEGELEGWTLLGFVLYIKENLNPKFEPIWSWFEGSWILNCSCVLENLQIFMKKKTLQRAIWSKSCQIKLWKGVCGPTKTKTKKKSEILSLSFWYLQKKKESNWPICDTTCESQVVSHLVTERWNLAASYARRISPSHVAHASRMWCTGVACCAFQVFFNFNSLWFHFSKQKCLDP